MPRSDGRSIASLLRNLHTVFRRDWASLHSHHLWQGFPFVYILIALLFVFLMTAVLALKSLRSGVLCRGSPRNLLHYSEIVDIWLLHVLLLIKQWTISYFVDR